MSTDPRHRSALPLTTSSSTAARAAWAGIATRAVHRVLEGAHPWGELEVWPSRYGGTTSCLVVYPPGAMRSERIRFRLMRAWPPFGMLLGLVVVVAAAHAVPLGVAGVLGAAVFGGGSLGLALLAGPSRRRIRELRAWRGDEGMGVRDRGPQAELDELSAVLLEAEHDHRTGRIDAVAFELVHGEVWRLIDAMPRRRS